MELDTFRNVVNGRSFKAELMDRPSGYKTPPPPEYEPLSPGPFSIGFKKRKHAAIFEDYSQTTLDAYGTHVAGDYIFPTETRAAANGHSLRANGTPRAHENTNTSPLDVFATVATSPSLTSDIGPGASVNLRGAGLGDRRRLIEGSVSKVQKEAGLRGQHKVAKRSRSEQIAHRTSLEIGSERPSTSHALSQSQRPIEVPLHSSEVADRSSKPYKAQEDTEKMQDTRYEATLLEAELLLGFALSNRNTLLRNSGRSEKGTLPNSTVTSLSNQQTKQVTSTMLTNGHHFTSTSAEGKKGMETTRGDATTQTPRAHKGWPKGKPRGPRNSGNALKKSQEQRKRKGAENRPSKSRRKSGNPDSRGHDARTTDDPTLTQGVVRAASVEPSPSTRDNHQAPNRSSVPPEIAMMVKAVKPGPGRPRVRRQSPLNICPVCKSTDNTTNGYNNPWIGCNGCKRWFHSVCAGFAKESVLRDVDKYFCPDCRPTHGPTTFVRKSSRAHASVDYAGLNEGNLRTAVDVPEHHYIAPIKGGLIDFTPETFPRMPPELVTAEYFEKTGGMREPVIIPARLNRPVSSDRPARGADDPNLTRRMTGHGSGTDSPVVSEAETVFNVDLDYDCVQDNGQDQLDMVIPSHLTVPTVAALYGSEERVEVIDVKLQEGEERRWNMRQWAEYYEAEGEKPVRNVISLEVSESRLGRLIRRPRVVRALDLQDAVWPLDEQAKRSFPKVQFYCLMSVADCYTDFHVDFGGSSVYYHILKGRKTFFFIPPKHQHLRKYEEWCLSPNQNQIWLGNETKECYRVDLYPGDTMLIPSGWIHAVWTPENSLVIGGNFLTRMHYSLQLQINEIEKNTGVGKKFRYPYFQKIMWYALIQYLQDDPVPSTVAETLIAGKCFPRSRPVYHEFRNDLAQPVADRELFNSRYYSKPEIDGLPDLLRFLLRTAMISLGMIQGVPRSSQEAVTKSLPKGYGDHVDLIKVFAMWIAWKRGNETIPGWSYPGANLVEADANSEKHASAANMKAAKRQAVYEASKASPEHQNSRQSCRMGDKISMPGVCVPGGKVRNGESTHGNPGSACSSKPPCDGCKQGQAQCKYLHPFTIARQFGVKHLDDADSFLEKRRSSSPGLLNKTAARLAGSLDLSNIIDPNPASPSRASADVVPSAENPPVSMKRPRTKACEECRKSKRRCVHDENGRVDPVKANETPVPRGIKRSRTENQSSQLADDSGQESHSFMQTGPVEAANSDRPSSTGFPGFPVSPNFLGQGSSPFNPMSIAVGGSITGLFEARSAFDEMRSWAHQPIENADPPIYSKPREKSVPRSHVSSSKHPDSGGLAAASADPKPSASLTNNPDDDLPPEIDLLMRDDAHTLIHGTKRARKERYTPSKLTTSHVHACQDRNSAIASSPATHDPQQAPPFSPLTDVSVDRLSEESTSSHEQIRQSQSTTPSIPPPTIATESNDQASSDNLSPLTESDRSADKLVNHVLHKKPEESKLESRGNAEGGDFGLLAG